MTFRGILIKQQKTPVKPLILIDSSYFSFYRFFATSSWYKKVYSPPDSWVNDPIFMEKYELKFREHVAQIAKQFQVSESELIFVRDCPQSTIWRNSIFPEYKAHRTESSDTGPGPVIKWSNTHILDNGTMTVLRVPGAEADDIIGTLSLHYQSKRPIWIIGNDSDYYQLLENCSTKLFKLSAKLSIHPVLPPLNANFSLVTKILQGDKTDGIPPIFPGCGPKRAYELAKNPEKLTTLLETDPTIASKFKLNTTLIDFQQIPITLQTDILQHYNSSVPL